MMLGGFSHSVVCVLAVLITQMALFDSFKSSTLQNMVKFTENYLLNG